MLELLGRSAREDGLQRELGQDPQESGSGVTRDLTETTEHLARIIRRAVKGAGL
jgi:hypothetical protein